MYQFHGCWYHGHDCHLNNTKYNETRKTTSSDLRKKTEEITTYIRRLGFNVIQMWECEWLRVKRNNPDLQEFLASLRLPHHNKKTMTQAEILKFIVDGSMFGLVECDIRVPQDLADTFAEMTPIFKNVEISREDIGEHMKHYAERMGVFKRPRRSLIGSMFGSKILLATPLLRWYLSHGLVVDHVYEIVEYSRNNCFREFGESVSDARRAGDRDPSNSILADTMKLLGNSAYGKTVTNQQRHRVVKVADETDAPRFINDNHFRALDDLGGGVYEVELTKRVINLNLPIQIGFFVYQYAKLRMLEFYYDFLMTFIHHSDFEMCEMDTDSAYLAISGNTLDEIIKPEKRALYEREKNKWFPREDTPAHKAFDKRTPGLFKVEWEGVGIVALCSKTYFCFGNEDKVSCKGLNKKTNKITKEKYLNVLRSQTSGTGINRGFQMRGGDMYTYEQTKTAFTYLYPKRKVNEDGRSTTYLDL